MTRTAAPVQVVHFFRRPIASRARQLQDAAALHQDADAVRLGQALAAALRQLAGERRDRPAFLHAALLDRAAGTLEEATWDEDPVALAEAREWLHSLASTIARTWGFREGTAGPLDGAERAARQAVHDAVALLSALERGALGEAALHGERLARELSHARRDREALHVQERAEALELRLGRGGDRLIALAAAALEDAALHALGSSDPGDLSRAVSARTGDCPASAARHAGLGLVAFAMRDPAALAEEAMAAAAHLRAPEAQERGWGPLADELLDKAEGLRAALKRRHPAPIQHAMERVEAALAWLDAIGPRRGGSRGARGPVLELVAAAG